MSNNLADSVFFRVHNLSTGTDYVGIRRDIDKLLDLDKTGDPDYVALYKLIMRWLTALVTDRYDETVSPEQLQTAVRTYLGWKSAGERVGVWQTYSGQPPANKNEAEAMLVASMAYLEKHAPERLKELTPVHRENVVSSQCYVQPVPDHCDRIVWKNSYYPLPPADMRATKQMAEQALAALSCMAVVHHMPDKRNPYEALRAYIQLTSKGS